MKFSERIGIKPVRTMLQIESIDEPLKNRLWNLIIEDLFEKLNIHALSYTNKESDRGFACKHIWNEFFGLRIDLIPKNVSGLVLTNGVIDFIKEWYFTKAQWSDVYDFIEFIADIDAKAKLGFVPKCNAALKREVSGYRIINDLIVQITSEEETQAIEEALRIPDKFKSVNTHLSTALDYLADRATPDYRNSIKESISAVEAFCILISGDEKATLGKALAIIDKKHSLHTSLKEAYSKIYGYTSNADGIRHAILEDGLPIEFEDAKFMLVSCSAFINYLKAKLKL